MDSKYFSSDFVGLSFSAGAHSSTQHRHSLVRNLLSFEPYLFLNCKYRNGFRTDLEESVFGNIFIRLNNPRSTINLDMFFFGQPLWKASTISPPTLH